MLGECSLQVLMRLYIKQQEALGSAPFTYLATEDKLKIRKTAGSRRESLKRSVFILILVGIWVQIYFEDKSKVEFVERLESFYIYGCFTILCVSKWSVFHHGADIVEPYNMFVSFEKTCIKGNCAVVVNFNFLFPYLCFILRLMSSTIAF